ncbi:protein S100-A11-like [Pelodytes ibericus]
MAKNLETCMVDFIGIFYKHASKDGNAGSLSKSELIELVTQEYPTLAANENKAGILDGIFGKMDSSKDGNVDFTEFMSFNACLCTLLYSHLCPS